jgi:hypothetical protein
MFKLNESIVSHVLGQDDTQFDRREELSRLNGDIASLKQRITNQISLFQEMTCETEDSVSAKKTLDEMQETIRDWYAYRDLLAKILSVRS